MTDPDRHRLSAYLRVLADRMGLKDWAVEVLAEWADAATHAEVRCPDGRKLAKVRFDRDWAEQTPEELRHTCCHELVHCHLAPVRADTGRRMVRDDFDTIDMLLEYAIDGIADGWAPCLPLMLDGKPRKGRGDDMGRQKTKVAEAAKAPQPKPKAGPKPAPTGKGKTPAK